VPVVAVVAAAAVVAVFAVLAAAAVAVAVVVAATVAADGVVEWNTGGARLVTYRGKWLDDHDGAPSPRPPCSSAGQGGAVGLRVVQCRFGYE
jgi:hypothetical protein